MTQAPPIVGGAEPGAVERLLRHERWLVLAALLAITVLSWLYLFDMSQLPPHVLVMPCCGADFSITFAMWSVMMAGMMIPSAAPMILTYAALTRRRSPGRAMYGRTLLFLSGYLLAWTLFSLLAAVAQWGLYQSSFYDPEQQLVAPWLGGAVLLLAGVFQLTPAKNACLTECRSPIGFFLNEWREGARGALMMGLKHGLVCIGCCWALMALLFVVGVMNLLWVAVISALVLLEKLLPWKRAVVLATAAACFTGAAWVMLSGRL